MKWHCQKRKCIIAVCMLAVLCFGGCSLSRQTQVSRTSVAMGTVVGITLYVEDVKRGEEVLARMEERLLELENRYLSYRAEESEIGQLNNSGGESVQLSAFLYENLLKVWEISQQSGGALDVTVGEVTRLWNIDTYADAPEGFTIPKEEELEEALRNVGYEKIRMDKMLTLPPGMTIDLGAVGKGIACDAIREILIEEEIPAAVISVGGSNLVWGRKENGTDWTVGVAHPREDGRYLGYLTLEGGSFVATSGDYERYVLVGEERYHHIMDPDTGCPARSGLCSVTIVSDSGLLSDALSTACFVLGKEEGLKLAAECGAEALVVGEDGSITMTEGMKRLWREAN